MGTRILVLSGVRAGTEFPLGEKRFSIGRDAAADLLLADQMVSRPHCAITFKEGEHYIEDARSQNGTLINAERLTAKRALRHGDRIGVGDTTLVYLTEAGTGSVEAPLRLVVEIPLSHPKIVGLERRSALLSMLLDVTSDARSAPDVFRERLIDIIFSITPADRAAILVFDREKKRIISKLVRDRRDPARHVDVSETVVRRVMAAGGQIISNDLEASGLSNIPSLSGVESIICVPLEVADRRLGVIYADSGDPNAVFDQMHLELLTAGAAVAAMAFENASLVHALQIENAQLKEHLEIRHDLIGNSLAVAEMKKFIGKAAAVDSTVLILGETGTGKELVARAIHQSSKRAKGPFVAVNCAVFSKDLVESELFGHEKGAFTGAIAQKKGKFEQANGGTLFLDEVGELPLALQPKLLRVLQEHEFERLGGTRTIPTDARIIAATNRDLAQEMDSGQFRQDLYYRLNILPIRTKPLSERPEDIRILANQFVTKYSKECKSQVRTISEAAQRLLDAYDWPGNIRELENVIERAVATADGDCVLPENLPKELFLDPSYSNTPLQMPHFKGRDRYQWAMIAAAGDYNKAAELIPCNPRGMHRSLRRYGLTHLLKSKSARG